jgi:hypothetical protein
MQPIPGLGRFVKRFAKFVDSADGTNLRNVLVTVSEPTSRKGQGYNWGTTRKWRNLPETTESSELSGLKLCLRNQGSDVQIAPGAP